VVVVCGNNLAISFGLIFWSDFAENNKYKIFSIHFIANSFATKELFDLMMIRF